MTNISTPQQSQYSFQDQTPTEPQAANIKVLDVLNLLKNGKLSQFKARFWVSKTSIQLEVPAKNLGLWKRSLTMDLGGLPQIFGNHTLRTSKLVGIGSYFQLTNWSKCLLNHAQRHNGLENYIFGSKFSFSFLHNLIKTFKKSTSFYQGL